MTTTHMQDKSLSELVFSEVKENMRTPLLNAQFVLDWVETNFTPGQVFYEKELRDWALSNGFVEDEQLR